MFRILYRSNCTHTHTHTHTLPQKTLIWLRLSETNFEKYIFQCAKYTIFFVNTVCPPHCKYQSRYILLDCHSSLLHKKTAICFLAFQYILGEGCLHLFIYHQNYIPILKMKKKLLIIFQQSNKSYS